MLINALIMHSVESPVEHVTPLYIPTGAEALYGAFIWNSLFKTGGYHRTREKSSDIVLFCLAAQSLHTMEQS